MLLLSVLLGSLFAAGLVRYEHQRGFFAPAWGPDGAVYFIERESRGLLFSADWFSSQSGAWSWVWEDQISIRRMEPGKRAVRTLRVWQESPVEGRMIRTPSDSAFGILLATLNTTGGLTFTVNVSVPETTPYGNLDSRQQQRLFRGRADNVVQQMREVMAVPGQGFYPAAIITTINNEDYEVLLSNNTFKMLYPDGVPATLLDELSHRRAVQEQARIVEKRDALIEHYERQGLDTDKAILRADADLERDGYQVVEPRLIATAIDTPAPGEKVFTLGAEDFDAGDFSDIAAAIARPGVAVKKSAESYTSATATGRALNQWLAGDQVSWVVASDGGYYRLLILY